MLVLKTHPDDVVFTPSDSAGLDGLEIVEAKREMVGQLGGFDHQFNTKPAVRAIVHDAKLDRFTLK
jgi:hypothetical protein